jgi:hypothetical protein
MTPHHQLMTPHHHVTTPLHQQTTPHRYHQLTTPHHQLTTPPTNDTTPPCDDTTPPTDNTTLPCDDTTPPTHNTTPSTHDTTHNGNSHKRTDKNINSKGTNNTTTRNTKKSQKGRKKQNREVLHCAANANPRKLALTRMQQNYWLTDEHIDHVQWLISRQFPAVKGFHSVLAFESKPPKVEKGLKGFVQIVNAWGIHWVTVTNIGCEENKIKVYDSLYRELSANDNLFATATAVAISLCSGHDPSEQAYDQSVMREHLAMCFMCEELAVFPLTQSQSNCVFNGRLEETEELFCHCRMPYAEDEFMIECSRCLGWFHRSCDNVPKTVRANTSFHCMNCK